MDTNKSKKFVEVKSKRVDNQWDVARISKMMGATTEVTIDFEKVTDRVRNKIASGLENYPTYPVGGYSSKARQLYDHVCKFYEIPWSDVDKDRININGLDNEQLYDEIYNVLYADAVARRMETGDDWYVQRLLRNCSKEEGSIYFYGMSSATWESVQQSGVLKRIQEYLSAAMKPKLDQALTTVQFGGKIKFKLDFKLE
jgi:hypothetical protein